MHIFSIALPETKQNETLAHIIRQKRSLNKYAELGQRTYIYSTDTKAQGCEYGLKQFI